MKIEWHDIIMGVVIVALTVYIIWSQEWWLSPIPALTSLDKYLNKSKLSPKSKPVVDQPQMPDEEVSTSISETIEEADQNVPDPSDKEALGEKVDQAMKDLEDERK